MLLPKVKAHHSLQFILSLSNPLSVIGVHHEYETLGVLEVVPPQGPDLVLAAHVPDSKADVLILYGLHVETLRWPYFIEYIISLS
jgi:hypothetical protein